MVDKAVTVTFTASTEESGQSIGIELDAAKNFEVHGSIRTQFQYGEKCYFRVYPYPVDLVLDATVSDGILSDEGSGVETVADEIVTFTGTETGRTAKPIKALISYTWMGTPRGAPTFLGKVLTIPEPTAGVLKVTYTTDFFRKAISIGIKADPEYTVVVLISGEAPEDA